MANFTLTSVVANIKKYRENVLIIYKEKLEESLRHAQSFQGLVPIHENHVESLIPCNSWFLEGLHELCDTEWGTEGVSIYFSIVTYSATGKKALQWELERDA